MTIRQEMLRAAGRSALVVPPPVRRGVVDFLRSRLGRDGGFADRAGASDLYYSVFGLEALLALEADFPLDAMRSYVASFEHGASLDFVHCCCLARAWAATAHQPQQSWRQGLLERIESYRCGDGGYHQAAGAAGGSAYGCFLATAAYQDLGIELPRPQEVVACLAGLGSADGAYANEAAFPVGLTAATAAAVVVLTQLGQSVPDGVADWLLERVQAQGGFEPLAGAAMADLLSTATAMHALASLGRPVKAIAPATTEFIMSLRDASGGFGGSDFDPTPDCEYTFYALLAMGHLA